MQPFGGVTVSDVSFFLGVKTPKVDYSLVMSNLRLPAPIFFFHPRKPPNTFQSVLVAGFAICSVLPVIRFAQIAKSIVSAISVDVVNLFFRHYACDVKPREPMGCVRFPVQLDVNVSSAFFKVTSKLTYSHLWTRRIPVKMASIWFIPQRGCELLVGHKEHFYRTRQGIASCLRGRAWLKN